MISGISFSNKINQDAIEILKYPVESLIIADGIGSLKYSAESSKFITEFLREKIKSKNLNLDLAFKKAFQQFKLFCEGKPIHEFGTTVITAINDGKMIHIASLGNCSAVLIKPEFVYFNPPIFTCLIAPDIDAEDKLTKFFNPIKFFRPDIYHLKLSSEFCIILTTDGAFSIEKLNFAKSSDNEYEIWQEYPKMIGFIISNLTHVKTENDLEELLKDLKDKFIKQIDDDTTIGIMTSPNFFNALNNKI
jgi:serine/threonine protein phosphatase PrpC